VHAYYATMYYLTVRIVPKYAKKLLVEGKEGTKMNSILLIFNFFNCLG